MWSKSPGQLRKEGRRGRCRRRAGGAAGKATGGTDRRCRGGTGEPCFVVARPLLEADDVVGGDVQRGSLLAVLALELAGAEAALDEDAIALAELFRGALCAIAEDAHPEPVGLLDPLTGLLVLGALVDRHAELRDRPAGRRVAHLRIAPEIADDHDLAERHVVTLPSVDGG